MSVKPAQCNLQFSHENQEPDMMRELKKLEITIQMNNVLKLINKAAEEGMIVNLTYSPPEP